MNRNRLIAHVAAAPQLLVAWFEERGLIEELETFYASKCAPSDEEQMRELGKIRERLEDIGYGDSEIASRVGSEISKKRVDIEARKEGQSMQGGRG